ncbi:hypothetical protein PQX77_017747 [Marasmius sp. AFHP31]|nr:hypothetical protein PQX77_017747 [Marasmius sp. AFHP31]
MPSVPGQSFPPEASTTATSRSDEGGLSAPTPSSLDTTNPTTTNQGTNGTTATPPRLSGTPTAGIQEAGNKSSATIGGVVGGVVGLILTVVVIVIVRRRRNRGSHRQEGWFTTGRRRQRPNLQVTALPITTPEPEHVVEKSRERRHQNADSPGPTVTGDQGAAMSSPGPAVDGQSGGRDSAVLAKLDMIMESVARLEADRDRDREEAPPDYTSNRS